MSASAEADLGLIEQAKGFGYLHTEIRVNFSHKPEKDEEATHEMRPSDTSGRTGIGSPWASRA